ncbi:MAG: sugar phosphate isomerase/epimerase family protein, partial [Armatimonadota bacterium]
EAAMQYVFFSKMLKGQSVEQMIASVKRIGADGFDLTVRPGYPVNPDNVAEALAPAARKIRAAGLSVPMISSPTSLSDPAESYVEPLFRACGEANIRLVKVGYWKFRGEGYWEAVDGMKKDVEGFATIGARYGVKPCLHTHSGRNLACNASALMHVLRDFDPKQVGAYLDPGHLNICGEPLSMAFEIVSDWLAIVAIKDSVKYRRDDGSTRGRFLPLGEGLVEWDTMMEWLVAHDFGGPLSFHSEFQSDSTEHLIEQTHEDIAYLRAIEQKVRAQA